MNREIKYKCYFEGKIRDVFEIDLFAKVYKTENDKGQEEHVYYGDRNNLPMQYIGLKDKNGKEIYEGHILQGSWKYIGEVEYDENFLQFRFKKGREIDYYGLDKIEIIGNIYESPELLK